MKLLADENLPPRLIQDLADLFPDSTHVSAAGLAGSSDAVIWDKDFANLSIVWGAPPKVILLQTGNCSTADVIRLLRTMQSGSRDSRAM